MEKLLEYADRCLCYTTDINYAFPTLLSCIQARANLSARSDVVMILFGASNYDISTFTEICSIEGIVFQAVPRSTIDYLPMDYARYFLHGLIDMRYKFVTHIDGDTHITGTLDPLLDFEIKSGCVLAVPDPIALIARTNNRFWQYQRKRMIDIGLTPKFAHRYVNTGLFQVQRGDLNEISRMCRTLALKEGSRLLFGQQDAFNIALGSITELASFRWNYPAFLSNFNYHHLVQPRVRHFMSNPRPWQGPFPPWGSVGHAPYVDFVRRHPELARFISPLQGHKRFEYEIQQQVKRIVEPYIWNTTHIYNIIYDHESISIVYDA